MARRYAIYDVFTEKRLAGNPLAVVFDADGLTEEAMQAIAQEFNLSETVFLLRPESAAHSARLRIFTPAHELPFAGHPTVGAAVAIAETAYGDANSALELMQVLEESVGPVRAVVRLKPGSATFAEFDLPRKPSRLEAQFDRQEIADALALKATQVGFENHVPSFWSAGVPFVMVPLHDIRSVASVEFDPQRWEHLAPLAEGRLGAAYLYCRGGINHMARFHTRMFAPGMGLVEDPATGSAAAALSGAVNFFDGLVDGHHPMLIEQGVEMGRPSIIHLHLNIAEGKIASARIGGHAVKLAEGELAV
ncbi:PhzF family phenazine biosynthesis isomerase [Sinorhizobium medicae]|uniref:PhzF family phenazine biosynthesis isomerase n=1 Tax=Sinorhizobium medicae TaxID=110321 RepID=A0A6G1WMM8_9HYPH|nr:PhzF family phenazine biosynthesis protein [Sinorhizobium medicae]MQW70897.1 PhzF family phenazine biosynthesis isomerase [Sinorhizobium medicae]MQX86213.1 PhzF family phenazine biosynthesis isomerase [Sinorhizobium medicae]RVJ73800.1 PhzF family phenazine biosynthesis protein [Sinorhizobium medicae]WQO84504.1 PhzF family phenazine biosynthesis protein [Sinorhizobium medicae]